MQHYRQKLQLPTLVCSLLEVRVSHTFRWNTLHETTWEGR